MKKILLSVTVLLLSLYSISATPEVWLGLGGSGARNYATESFKNAIIDNGTTLYKKGVFEYLNTVGTTAEIMLKPSAESKLGLYASTSINYFVGIDSSGYRSYHFDNKKDIRIGLSSVFMKEDGFNGYFVDLAYNYSWYRIAATNTKNTKTEPSYIRFQESALYADAGFLLRHEDSYFKMGLSYRMPIWNEDNEGKELSVLIGLGKVL